MKSTALFAKTCTQINKPNIFPPLTELRVSSVSDDFCCKPTFSLILVCVYIDSSVDFSLNLCVQLHVANVNDQSSF